MAFISSSKNSSGNKDGDIACVSTSSTIFPTASASVATISQDTASAYIASQSNGSQMKFKDINQIDEDDMEEMDIKWSFHKREQSTQKSGKGRKESYRQGSKAKEKSLKALMDIDRVGWDWSYMANEGEDHALVADAEAYTEFALMANTESQVFDNSLCSNDCKKNNNSLNSKIKDLTGELSEANNYIYHYKLVVAQLEGRLVEYKEREVKYIETIRTLEMYRASNLKCIKTLDKELEELKLKKDGLDGKLACLLKASKNLDNLIEIQRPDKVKEGVGYNVVPPPAADLYLSPKKDLSWTGLPEFVDDTVIDYSRPSPTVAKEIFPLSIGNFSLLAENLPLVAQKFTLLIWEGREKLLTNELEMLKKEKKGLDSKLTGFQSASKDIDTLLGSQRHSPNIESKSNDLQNNSSFVSENGESTSSILSKFEIKFMKAANSPTGNSQNVIDDKRYWDIGCSWHMTGNISYLSDYEPFDGGDFKLRDDTNVLLRTPRQHNMYSIDLNNIIPHKDLTCLIAKAFVDESELWHKRLGHLNFKTMNRLVRHNLVKGLPSKCFDNDHTCVACLKGKQHKASLTDDFSRFTWTFFLRTKDETSGILRNFITEIENLKDLKVKIIRTPAILFLKPFGCHVMILNTLDNLRKFEAKGDEAHLESSTSNAQDTCKADAPESSGNSNPTATSTTPLANHMETLTVETLIPTVSSLVPTACLDDSPQLSKFSNARTPQQNGVAERRNRTLIEAARTMLADAKLPVTFWLEAVYTACYVQNRVLVNKSQNKTPYELFNGRAPAIGFLKLFGCHVMILNTLDNLGKFEAKRDEGYFIGYSMSSKAFRVFNKRTRRVEENLHIEFLEKKAIKQGAGPNWLFDIDSLTKSMNYVPVDAGTNSTNFSGTKDAANQEVKKNESSLKYIVLPN
nr:ribonuclease H-like domain-containing protein [Tanacetum cinerariifolium]